MSIQYALGVEAPGLPPGAFPRLVEEATIAYSFLPPGYLQRLEALGIPARGPLPFATPWLGHVNHIRETNPHAAAWLASLVFTEFGLMYWLHCAFGVGLINDLSQGKRMQDAIRGLLGTEDVQGGGASPTDLKIKWWLDDLALRIRAIWDKIPHALAESSIPRLELKGARHSGRLNELERHVPRLQITEEDRVVMQALIGQARSIEYIKAHRDAEAHKHSKRTAELFGAWGEDETLIDIWGTLGPELNRAREALIGTLGVILLPYKEKKA